MAKKEKEYIYHFPITLAGTGKTPSEAWNDAVEAFMQDPGCYDRYDKIDEVK